MIFVNNILISLFNKTVRASQAVQLPQIRPTKECLEDKKSKKCTDSLTQMFSSVMSNVSASAVAKSKQADEECRQRAKSNITTGGVSVRTEPATIDYTEYNECNQRKNKELRLQVEKIKDYLKTVLSTKEKPKKKECTHKVNASDVQCYIKGKFNEIVNTPTWTLATHGTNLELWYNMSLAMSIHVEKATYTVEKTKSKCKTFQKNPTALLKVSSLGQVLEAQGDHKRNNKNLQCKECEELITGTTTYQGHLSGCSSSCDPITSFLDNKTFIEPNSSSKKKHSKKGHGKSNKKHSERSRG